MKKTSFTIPLTGEQAQALAELLATGNFRARTVPYTIAAAEGADCTVAVYQSGKCVVQGRGAEDFVLYTLEPQILKRAGVGYEEALDPEGSAPHMGVDESGKGDFFGPLVVAAAYVDEGIASDLRKMGVRDSKAIRSDRVAMAMAGEIRERLGNRFAVVTMGPEAYNRLHGSMGTVNKVLAWGHARAIEDLLEKVPGCPRALSDQFGPTRQIEMALLKRGRTIRLDQRPKAESDVAVAAASILARAGFLAYMARMGKQYGLELPKGASERVKAAGEAFVARHGAGELVRVAKCHFKTLDEVLAAAHTTRAAAGLPPAPAGGHPKFVVWRRPKPE
jgi:ribonuclease HIII